MWYERTGGGFPVVFMHSGLMDARISEPQFEAGASKRVVAETDQLVNVGKPERFNRLALDFLAFAG